MKRFLGPKLALILVALVMITAAIVVPLVSSRVHAHAQAPAGSWSPTGSMSTAREQHTATLLPNGQVLVAGGQNNNVPLASAELYNLSTGTWTPTGSMTGARAVYTATLLHNGQVLVAGGQTSGGAILSSAELYDPSTGTWTATGSMSTARRAHTATLLSSGQVLVAGGANSSGFLASAELFSAGAAAQISDLITLVNSFNLSPGIQTSFDSQLQAVQAAIAASNTVRACSSLTSFINYVKAQSGKVLTMAQADQLLAAAKQLQAVLNC